MRHKRRTLALIKAKRRLDMSHHVNQVVALGTLANWFQGSDYGPRLGEAAGELGRFAKKNAVFFDNYRFRDYLEEICK